MSSAGTAANESSQCRILQQLADDRQKALMASQAHAAKIEEELIQMTAARQQKTSELAGRLENLQQEFAQAVAAQQLKLANMENLVGELRGQLSAAKAVTPSRKVSGSKLLRFP